MLTSTMLSVEEALDKLLGYFHPLEPEEKPLLRALGQVLAEDVLSDIDIPPIANSSMDGFAVRAADVKGASATSPKPLRVIGSAAAGSLPRHTVREGMAVRIMTGAPIPEGADAVVPFEDTDEVERRTRGEAKLTEIAVVNETQTGWNVRPPAKDVARGNMVLKAGTLLRQSEIGVLASLGRAKVRVIRRPVVAVLPTGDEIVEPGHRLPPGKIYNANGYSVAASVARYGGIPKVLGIARDNVASLTAKVRRGLDSDMLITTAGVSKGDYDIVKDVLADMGKIAFWTVRMRPGKPIAFGLLYRKDDRDNVVRKIPHLGLPGNPVSAMVTFEELARPAIYKMMGRTDLSKPTVSAILEEAIVNSDGRRLYARVVVTRRNGAYYAKLSGPQDSNILTSMARANGLAICPEGVPVVRQGDTVKVQMLDWNDGQS